MLLPQLSSNIINVTCILLVLIQLGPLTTKVDAMLKTGKHRFKMIVDGQRLQNIIQSTHTRCTVNLMCHVITGHKQDSTRFRPNGT